MITIKRDKFGHFIQGVPFHSEETKKKIAQSHIGIGKGIFLSQSHRNKISESMKRATVHMRSKKDCDSSFYQLVHQWIRRKYGKPQKCDKCGRTKPPKGKGLKIDYFHWANKSGLYLKIRSDWDRLCSICHRNYDYSRSI